MITKDKPVDMAESGGIIIMSDLYTGCNIQFTLAGAEETWRRLKDLCEQGRKNADYPMRSYRNESL